MRAWALKRRGWSNVKIAEALGVSATAVGRWIKTAAESGTDALARRTRLGQGQRLSPAALAQLPSYLELGPEHYGFLGGYWSCLRVAKVIERVFGVRYSSRHVGRCLKRLNWSFHKPQMRAVQRSQVAVDRWLGSTWPALRERAENEGRTIVFLDEAAFYMSPTVDRSWAPAGTRFELRGPLSRAHLSVIGALTWEGSLYLQTQAKSLGSAGVVRFLRHLLQHIPGPILLLWDGARIHRSAEIREFLALDRDQRLVHEHFPAYAPEVDPQEYVWHQLKHVDLRNLTTCSLDELWRYLQGATRRLRTRVGVLKNFIKHAGIK